MPTRRLGPGGAVAAATLAASLLLPPAAHATTYHTTLPGQSFWAIATANGVSPYTLAAANGKSISSTIYPGETLSVPTPSYGSSYGSAYGSSYRSSYGASSTSGTSSSYGSSYGASSSSGASSAYGTTSTSSSGSAAAYGMVPIPAATGTAYLAPSAAANLAALRRQSQQRLGVDVYAAGPMSGFRTYAQQAMLYRLYREGLGPVAAPPGYSLHETGRAIDLAAPVMRTAVDTLGAPYGWRKTEAPSEWWHVNYTGG